MKRWKAILEEYNHELHYKPGTTNVVADALSRTTSEPMNALSTTQHSDESSSDNLIPHVETPINVFKNQIFLNTGLTSTYQFKIIFPTYHRHILEEPIYNSAKLINLLRRYLNPSVANCIKTEERIMGKIQEIYPVHFSNYKIRFTQLQVEDITNETEQEEIILREHQRAHRNSRENKTQILKKYYFPSMYSKIEKKVKQCSTCLQQKYDRHPPKPVIQATPIPQNPGEIVHIDIYSTEKRFILTSVDKYSKYAQVKIIQSRAVEHIKDPIRELMIAFGIPKLVVIDNEKSLNSASISSLLKDEMNIEVYVTPPYASTTNGQVERFHSTLSEIMRCLKSDNNSLTFEELLFKSVKEYNSTIHSTTKKKPLETFFGTRVTTDPQELERHRQQNVDLLTKKQVKDLDYHNKKRKKTKDYSAGEEIFVKINKRLGTKISPRYRRELVKEDKNTTILTESGKLVHKSNIRS